eukprot:742761-Rhodomonas_salina.1
MRLNAEITGLAQRVPGRTARYHASVPHTAQSKRVGQQRRRYPSSFVFGPPGSSIAYVSTESGSVLRDLRTGHRVAEA